MQPRQSKYFSGFLYLKALISGRKVPEGELCAVCSDRATGYHYGTPSCNGW